MKTQSSISDAELARQLGIPADIIPASGVPATSRADNPVWLALFAALVSVALWFVPFAHYAVYPFRMLSTFIHEISHAIVALLSGGSVDRITMQWNTSGQTLTQGGWALLIASAGYVGATVVGSLLLRSTGQEKLVKPLLLTLGAVLLLCTIVFGGNSVVWIWGLILAAGLTAAALLLPRRLAKFALSFLSIQVLLNSVFDLDSVIRTSIAGGVQTDATNLAQISHGFIPALVWAIGWSAVSGLTLFVTLRSLVRSNGSASQAETLRTPKV